MAESNKMKDMPVNQLMIQMGIPMILSMALQAVYNIVDSAFVGNMRVGSEAALNALTLVFPIQMLMVAVGIGTGVGTNALLARMLGQGNNKKAAKAAGNSLFLGVIIYVVCLLFGLFGVNAYITSQTVDPEVISMGTEYLRICCVISFGIVFFSLFEKLLQATGRSFYSTIGQVVGAVVNIILDPILIFGLFGAPKLGVSGAAVATVFGQICAASLACFFNKKKNDDIVINPKKYHLQAHAVKSIYAIGVPSICMASIGSIMTFGMNKILIGFTSTAAAVFGVYFKLQSFIFMPVFGLNNGMVPIIGFNYGARKPDRLMKTMRLAVTYAVSIMIIGMILFWTFTPQLLAIFNASAQMLSIGIPALRIISLSFLLAGFDIIIISVMQALGHGVISLIISILRQLAVLLPVAFIFSKIWGLNAVWIAFPLAECVALVVTILFWRKVYRNEIQPLYNAER